MLGPLASAAQPPLSDSVRSGSAIGPVPSLDSLRLIPCGPAVGTINNQARVTVADTVAGWARILVEGWVPVGLVLSRMHTASIDTTLAKPAEPAATKPERQRCQATTKKGTPCTRYAAPGSKYCWQHQRNH